MAELPTWQVVERPLHFHLDMPKHYGLLPPGLPKGDPEDCGSFCVWWYTYPVRDPKRPGRFIDAKRWAFARRSICGTYWHTSSPTSGFRNRTDAVSAGSKEPLR